MDHKLGLESLKHHIASASDDIKAELATLETRLVDSHRREHLFGYDEAVQKKRSQITFALNSFALEHCGVSFNDLCQGKLPIPHQQTETKGDGDLSLDDALYGTGNRWAVLVGVNEYEDTANFGQLQVCVKDVVAIRKQLIVGGFEESRVHLLTDHTDEPPNRNSILTTLKSVAEATEPDDLLLFYYSGHGDESDGDSYLVTRDGRWLVLSDTAVQIARVKEIMEQAPARAKVIILDACHSGADIGGKGPKPMSAEFLQRVFEQAEGMAILASCKQGQLSYEWRKQERSVFTHFLLEALAGQADRDEKGFVTVQDANRDVVNGVKLWSSQNHVSQTPTLQYSVAGDIILVNIPDSPEKSLE